MSMYGSYPPSSGYDYTGAMQPVVVPPLPNETNHYQLPDQHYGGTTTYENRYHNQNVYYNDKVIVTDHIIWQPYHVRTYDYVPPTITQGPVTSWTDGQQPPTALPYPSGNQPGGYYTGNAQPTMPPYGNGYPSANAPANGNIMGTLQQLLSTVMNLLGSLQGPGNSNGYGMGRNYY